VGVPFAPWLSYPVQVLGWLLWCEHCDLHVSRWEIHTTLDALAGHIAPPLTFLLAFDIDIFLNPGNWPGPLYLLPNIVFVGGGLFAVICRYRHTVDFEQKQAMRGYVWGISLLVVLYLINLLMTDVYYLIASQSLFQSNSALLTYVLFNEPIWFACETFFAIGLALAVFRDNLLEESAP
jgi:hypothetical protein